MSVGTVARKKAADTIDHLRPSIAAAQRGDQAAFRLLYQEYARSIYNLVFRCVRNPQASEDVCQEIWVKAFRELPKLQDPQAFPAWLYRLATRACIDSARKNRRVPATAQIPEEVLSDTDVHTDPERSALRRESVRLTWEAMATMPTRQHVALYLREMQNMSYREIAQMLGTSQTAVEMLLFRARQGFAKAYQRLEAGGQERCGHARHSMAALIDGEATSVQRNAIVAHVDTCRPCSGELTQMRRTAAAYSALLPLSLPAVLGGRVFEAIGGSGINAVPLPIAKLFGLFAVKAKVASVTIVATAVTTAATVAAVNSPVVDEIRPGPSSSHTETQRASPESQTRDQAGELGPRDSFSTGVEDDAVNAAQGAQPPPHQDQDAPLSVDPNIPVVAATIDELTAPINSTIDQTTGEIASSLDPVVDELSAIMGEVPAPPPIPVETPPIPTLPPLPTPTVPPLPLLP